MHLYNLSQHFILLSYILTYIQHHNSPSVSTVALTFPLFSAWRLSQSTTGVIEAEWTARYTFYVHILDVTIWPFGRRCLWCCRISKTVIFPYSLIFSLLPSYMYSLGPVTWYGHICSTVPHGRIVSWTCFPIQLIITQKFVQTKYNMYPNSSFSYSKIFDLCSTFKENAVFVCTKRGNKHFFYS